MDRFYIGNGYEVDVKSGGTTERLYLGGDAYSAPAVYIKDASTGSWNLYYICRDYLGSITAITNSSGSLVQELSYDAWGRLRDPEAREVYAPDSEPTLLLGRGFTGHEHLPWLNLVNMNGRLYDPLVGRFLNVDPYVQMPDFTQNFNRYSYGLNNPLKYTDPDGEFFIIDDWIIGGIIGLFNGEGFWKSANRQAGNCAEIYGGLFATDPNRDFWGRSWQLIYRFTWEYLQTGIGLGYSLTRNTFGKVDRVDYFGGATFATNENSEKVDGDGISISNYININIHEEINQGFDEYVISNPVYMHEYGHYIDSQLYGLSYLFVVGLPSIFSAGFSDPLPISKWEGRYVDNPYNLTKHKLRLYELRANKNASRYFSKYYNVDWNNFPRYPIINPFELLL